MINNSHNVSYVSFTGIDDETNVKELVEFQKEYPSSVYGCLISSGNLGTPRYPSLNKIKEFIAHDIYMRYHICGSLARSIDDFETISLWFLELLLNKKTVLQINLPNYNLYNLLRFREMFNLRSFILQWREENFEKFDSDFIWLFDRSGGRGIESEVYPKFHNNYNGFAGGINPENVLQIAKNLTAKNPDFKFWLDVESGVRENENFSLDRCTQILNNLKLDEDKFR